MLKHLRVISIPLLIALMVVGLWSVTRTESLPPTVPAETALKQGWEYYKTHLMVNRERVHSNNYDGTISEGQSYAMLKAVWMNDPDIFARTWQWTRTHMSRSSDYLLGWRWGQASDGSLKLINNDNATDADEDIAYALLLAGEKWHNPAYITDATHIIGDLWRLNVKNINGHYYLAPGTWEGFGQEYLTVDPSYYAPYVYRKFAEYDTAHAEGWKALAEESYPLLEACSDLTANKLPPNWCAVHWDDNSIGFSDKQGKGSRDFSYDAFRVFWRMSMDAAQGSQKAEAYLKKHDALQRYWEIHKTLPEGFSSTGEPLGHEPSGFALSAALAQHHAISPETDESAYQEMLGPYYNTEGYWFNGYNDYLHSVIWLHLYAITKAEKAAR